LKTQRPVAIKVFEGRSLDKLEKEARLYRLPNKTNVIDILGVCENPNKSYLIMEHAKMGSLRKVMMEGNLTLSFVLKAVLEIARGMESFQNGFRSDEDLLFHGDLKSENILVVGEPDSPSELWVIKIADFGESHDATEGGKRKGTIPYMAPEVWTKNFEKMPKYNWMNADVWSFGVICWELLCACSPAGYQSPSDGYKALQMDTPLSLESGLLNGKRLLCPKLEDARSLALFDLVLLCWQFQCGSRPDWQMIIQALSRIQVMPAQGKATPEVQRKTPEPAVLLREIPWSEITCSTQIDKGAYGTVFKGTWHGAVVAVKKLHVEAMGKRVLQEVRDEALILCRIEHSNVIVLHGVCLEQPNFALVVDNAAPSLYLFLGDLLGVFPIGDQYLAALQIARGMQAIHHLNVLHHDLRAANILIGPEGQRRCRIADFGLSRAKMESSRFSAKQTGNPAWSAPEYLAGNTPFTAACDVFSYGMVLFEICSDPPGTAPFDGQGDNVRSLYLEGKRPLIPKGADPQFAQLMQFCWN
jgi:serine/threonine protein kinase